MIAAIEALTRRYDMLPRDGLVLIAVSGGMDSMCLLHYLSSSGVPVAAAHFNHQLRGDAADEDERFVRDWCAERGIACYVGGADVSALARERGWSVEEAGRSARYAFLERTADEIGAKRIATAHHARDNAETLLFNLARGSGTDGLGGIAPVRGRLIRPMLTVTPEEIAAYAREHAVPYRADASNDDTAYTRNYIRHEILPLLTTVNASAVAHMSETALRARQESAFLDELAEKYLQEMTCEPGSVTLDASALAKCPEVLRVRALRRMLDRLGAGKKDYTARHYAALEALAQCPERAQLDLPGGVRALRSDGTLTLTVRRQTPPETALTVGQELIWGDYTVCLSETEEADAYRLRRDITAHCLSVGAWRSGEYLTLAGAKTPRSLKRLFAERGIAPHERDALPVLRVDGRAAAVFGLGAAAEFAAAPEDEALYCCIYKNQ